MISRLLLLLWIVLVSQCPLLANTSADASPRHRAVSPHHQTTDENLFDLTAFGAVGDGVTDDGPALQAALDAIAEAGGGSLFVPAGLYAIITPVQKDFTGLASAVTISGVESSITVPPPTASGSQLSRGLSLVSEFRPQTGIQGIAINITGLRSFLIKDIAFMGTPGVSTDAYATLSLNSVDEATVRHCEFYGLSTQGGPGIIYSVRSGLTVEQSAFLGSTANSGYYASVIQNLEWKSITVTNTVFVDYGQRPELFTKTHLSAPLSWINIGNAAALTNNSPRREVVLRSVFFDEGGLAGLSSLPFRYQPPSAPIDLVYVTGLYMNVSNLGTSGHYLDTLQNVLIESSGYGWSHNADSAINLMHTDNAILDRVVTEASATRIRAAATTRQLIVINSIYQDLASLAQTTKVITTATLEEDPVQYVRQQFVSLLGREPDAAAHFYWANRLLQCQENMGCTLTERASLLAYLDTAPTSNFSVTGRVRDQNGQGVAGVVVTLSGSQSVATATDSDGKYQFSHLPTSGIYTVIPSKVHYTFKEPSQTFTTPNGDKTADFTATLNRHSISGRIADASGQAVASVTVTLSGTQSATTTTDTSGNFAFASLPAGGSYTLVPSKTHYTFAPVNKTFNNLSANQLANFTATLNRHSISGRIADASGQAVASVTVTLSGTQSATTTTDTSGNFAFASLPAGGSYTLVPSKTHYTFAPVNKTFNDLSTNQLANFTATLNRHSISGRIADASGQAVASVTVTLSGTQSATTTTDTSGNFAFASLPAGGSYTLVPSKTHYTFAPVNKTFNDLSTNQLANFTATLNRHSISGRIADASGQAVASVTVTLSGTQSATTTTDTSGNFAFASLPAGGSYTLVPSKTHYTFAPVNKTFNNLSANQVIDLTATLNQHSISGRVINANNYGISGVLVTLSGSQATTTMTDANGNFIFARIPAGGNYIVTPSLVHHSFNPKSQTYNNLGADQYAQYIATLNTHSISGQVTIDGAGFANAEVTLYSPQTVTTVITGGNGAYSFTGLIAGANYTVTVTKAKYTFVPASQTFNDLGSDQTANFRAFANPVLVTVENSERAIALESLTFATPPFPLLSTSPLGSTTRTRIIVFATHIDLLAGESASAVTAQAEDSQHRILPLTVEYVGRVPEVNGYTQINLMLPDQPTEGGDLWITLTYHGMQSNKASIAIKPS